MAVIGVPDAELRIALLRVPAGAKAVSLLDPDDVTLEFIQPA